MLSHAHHNGANGPGAPEPAEPAAAGAPLAELPPVLVTGYGGLRLAFRYDLRAHAERRGLTLGMALPTLRIVMLDLAEHAHRETGRAWPSQATLAERTGYKERHVRDALYELVRLGVVQQAAPHRRGGRGGGARSAAYVVVLDPPETDRRPSAGATGTPVPPISPAEISPAEISPAEKTHRRSDGDCTLDTRLAFL